MSYLCLLNRDAWWQIFANLTRVVLFIVICSTRLAKTAENWPSFQNGGNLSLPEDSLPVKWSAASRIDWSVPIPGYGQSSPVVWNGQVYVTSVSGPQKDAFHVAAFDLDDGARLWKIDIANAFPQANNNYISRAAATPAADQNGLVCFFEGGNIVALNHAGNVRWQRNLVAEYGPIETRHGLAASVEQDHETAYIWVERRNDPYVLAIDKSNGLNHWKATGIGATSWSSPRLVPVGNRFHLVLSGSGRLTGLNPETGRQLWTFADISGNSTPTPVPVGEGRFLIGATVGRAGDGSGSAADSNGLIAIRQKDDGQWQAEYVWRAQRATSSFGSPMAHRGLAYFVNRSGVVYALDLESGQEAFTERLGDSIWATPLGAANRIFFFGKSGTTSVIASGKQFRPLVACSSWENEAVSEAGQATKGILYAAAFSHHRLLLRRGDRLICIVAESADQQETNAN